MFKAHKTSGKKKGMGNFNKPTKIFFLPETTQILSCCALLQSTLYKKQFALMCYVHTGTPTKAKLNAQVDKSDEN